MPLQFAANLTFQFTEVGFLDRFALAAKSGFRFVEFLFPYDFPPDVLHECLLAQQLQLVLFNAPVDDWHEGGRGIACHPGKHATFAAQFERALAYAQALGCQQIHALAGLRCPGVSEADHRQAFCENVRWAADQCAKHGVTLMIEPINSRVDMPGYWLDDPAKAFEIAASLAHPALRVQLDIYHAQVMGYDPAALIRSHASLIGHCQIADAPGRHEPGTGEINFPAVFNALAAVGYTRWIGCEYRPAGETIAGLGWLPSVGNSL